MKKGKITEEKEEIKANLKNATKKKLIISLMKFSILIIIVIGIPLYLIIFKYDFITSFKSFSDVIIYLNKYETTSIIVYISFQIMQIVISILPGQAFQFAAGYIFGFAPGLIYSIIGALGGTLISFYLGKYLGKDALHLIFGKEKINYFLERLNSEQSYVIVFLIYLIPGIPKDIVSYVAGASEMSLKPLILLSMVGRMPGMMGSLVVGALYESGTYLGVIIVASAAIILFVLGIIFRKKIIHYVDKIYLKISK